MPVSHGRQRDRPVEREVGRAGPDPASRLGALTTTGTTPPLMRRSARYPAAEPHPQRRRQGNRRRPHDRRQPTNGMTADVGCGQGVGTASLVSYTFDAANHPTADSSGASYGSDADGRLTTRLAQRSTMGPAAHLQIAKLET